MISVISTSRSEERIELVRSEATCSVTSAGSSACSSGSMARTESTVWMTLADGWRVTRTMIAGSPLKRPSVRVSSTLSITSATSCRRTAAPLRQATTIGA